jgi:AraC family transcriptional regulator, melibiose operon regulatory protein
VTAISEKLMISYRVKGQGYSLDFHTHPQYEIFLFHGGDCRFLVGDQIYYLQPGDLLMMDGMTVHRAYVLGDKDAYERSIVHFDSEWILPLLKDLKIDYLLKFFTENRNGLIRTFQKKDEIQIENMIENMNDLDLLDQSDTNEAKRKLAMAQLLLLIDSSTHRIVDKGQTFIDEKTQIAQRVAAFLFEHYRESFSIEDVANALNMSKSYLSHAFKEITGQTIMSYAMGYRLSQASVALMMQPKKSIKEISRECGFESDAHFSRYFKQNLGVTPSNYRKNKTMIVEKGE